MPIPVSSILPTLEDLKARANVTSVTHDAELQDMLDAAVEVVEGYVGSLDGVSVTETHYDVRGRSPLVLRRAPVLSVQSVTSSGAAVDAYTLDGAAGLLRPSSSWWSGDVTVTYTAGRAVLPAAVREAILIVAVDLWGTQRGNAPSALPVGESGEVLPGGLPLLPPKARDLLAPFLLGPVVA